MMGTFSQETERQFQRLVAVYPEKRSALIPMLILAQRELGWVTPDAIRDVAEYLDLSASEVESVASFYTMLHLKPIGRHEILVCTNIACMLAGSDFIRKTLEDKAGARLGETSPDGAFTLIEAECLGSCTTAPVIQIDGEFHENLTPEKTSQIVEDLGRNAKP
jgi:NADH-quinone oxidoreductase E subunit